MFQAENQDWVRSAKNGKRVKSGFWSEKTSLEREEANNWGKHDPADTVFEISDVQCPKGHAGISYVLRGHTNISHSPYYKYIHQGVVPREDTKSMKGSQEGIQGEI